MEEALILAQKAYDLNEVPIGAVVVYEDKIIGKGYNFREKSNIINDHAEIIALNQAAKALGTWKLEECELYVTSEPCMMCFGAIYQSRIKKIYVGSKQKEHKKLSYKTKIEKLDIIVSSEYKIKEAEELLKKFFKEMRRKND
jgi:tRNA(adenine34) deaminase